MITSQQFGVLLKQKTLKKNSLIEIQRITNVPISETYVKQIVKNDKGFLSKVKYVEEKDTYLIGYVKASNHEKVLMCELKDIKKIEGQDPERYYQSFVDILANSNPIVITNETNVEETVIGLTSAILDGHKICEGMKFILKNDKNPEYNDKILNVRMVGKTFTLKKNTGRPKTKR